MALTSGHATELPCGRALAQLVEQVADRSPPADPEHQASCRYCQAALAELDAIWGDVGELARQRVEVPPGLLAATMRRIVRERGGGDHPPLSSPQPGPRPGRPRDHALLAAPRGSTRISDGIVAAVAGRAAVAVTGVRLRGQTATEVRFEDATVALALELTVAIGVALPPLVAAARVAVVADVEALTGLSVTAVDIAVADIHDG